MSPPTLFRRAAFVTSVRELHTLPPEGLGEIAFAGRSNAGKSSAINALADAALCTRRRPRRAAHKHSLVCLAARHKGFAPRGAPQRVRLPGVRAEGAREVALVLAGVGRSRREHGFGTAHAGAEPSPVAGTTPPAAPLPPDAVLDALKPLRYIGNDIIVFHVLDPQEINFDFDDASVFQDLESGEQWRAAPCGKEGSGVVVAGLVAPVAGILIDRVNPKYLMMTGCALLTLGYVGYSMIANGRKQNPARIASDVEVASRPSRTSA